MVARSTRILSVCAGVGMLDLGIKLAVRGARTVCYIEREVSAVAVLAARMQDSSLDDAAVWSDLATFDGKPWRGVVDCIIGGLPCQPFSVAGRQQGEADDRYLWPAFFRVLGEVRPALVFLENVPALLGWFEPIGERLCEMGYGFEAGIFSAAEVGASHRRERLFVLAHSSRNERQGSIGQGGRGGRVRRTGEYMALSSLGGRGVLREPSGGAGQLDGKDEGLADPGIGLVSEPGRGAENRAGVGPAGAVVVELGGCLLGPFPPGPQDRDAWAAVLERYPELAPAVARFDLDMVEAQLHRTLRAALQVGNRRARSIAAKALATRIREMLYPPATQCPVRHLVDGSPAGMDLSRADQLRALGNGVVPLTAAFAFRVLADRAGLEVRS